MDRELTTSQHVSMKIPDDIQTFRVSSLDTRGAVSFSTKNCPRKMFTLRADFGAVPENWIADLAALLEGAPATRRA